MIPLSLTLPHKLNVAPAYFRKYTYTAITTRITVRIQQPIFEAPCSFIAMPGMLGSSARTETRSRRLATVTLLTFAQATVGLSALAQLPPTRL